MKTVTGSILVMMIGFGFAALPLTAGCDHEVAHSSDTVQHPDGTVSHQDSTVTQKPNGDVVKQTNVQNP